MIWTRSLRRLRRPSLTAVVGILIFLAAAGCRDDAPAPPPTNEPPTPAPVAVEPVPPAPEPLPERPYKVVHVIVALCDNAHQGIVPVPAALGNGQDPKNNLYWGAMYGVKTYLRRSDHWRELAWPTRAPSPYPSPRPLVPVLDQVIFARGDPADVYIVAEAYDGANMGDALSDFFAFARGEPILSIKLRDGDRRIDLRAAGAADMVVFVGHNGLMDGPLPVLPDPPLPRQAGRSAVVLCCKSINSATYSFRPLLDRVGCDFLLGTMGLMAPEAYTLDALVRTWADGGSPEEIRVAAAEAYAKYQKCSTAAAMRLFNNALPETR